MAEIINNLDLNLKKQTQLYKELIEFEIQKQESLVNNTIQEIEEITIQEEKILHQLSRLEDERLHWAEFFGKEIGKKAEEITLADLVESFPALTDVRIDLEKEMVKLKDLHETNTKLLENAVNIVNFTIQSLTNERQTTYSDPSNKAKKKEEKRNVSIIDRSI